MFAESLFGLSRLGSLPSWLNCTMVVLINLADPYFVGVNCHRDFLMHVMCTEENTHASKNAVVHRTPTQFFCNSSDVLQNPFCLNFEWINTSHSMVQCTAHPTQFPNIFHSVQTTIYPPFLFASHTVFVTKFYNYLAFSEKHLTVEGMCTNKLSMITESGQGGNIFGCFEMMGITSNVYFHILTLCDARKLCSQQENVTGNCECPAGLNITKKCKIYTEGNGTKYCSPLLNKTVNGDCEMYLKFKLKKPAAPENSVEWFVCHSTQHIYMELVNDLVEDCVFAGDDEVKLKIMLQRKMYHKCKEQYQMPCREGHPRCFNISQICMYKVSSRGKFHAEQVNTCRTVACLFATRCSNASTPTVFLGSTLVMESGIVLMGLMNQPSKHVDRQENAKKCSAANHLKHAFIWILFVTAT